MSPSLAGRQVKRGARSPSARSSLQNCLGPQGRLMELFSSLAEQAPASPAIKAPTTRIIRENSICQDIHHAPWRRGVPSFHQKGLHEHKMKLCRVRHWRGSRLHGALGRLHSAIRYSLPPVEVLQSLHFADGLPKDSKNQSQSSLR